MRNHPSPGAASRGARRPDLPSCRRLSRILFWSLPLFLCGGFSAPAAAGGDCTKASLGLVPLNDLGPSGRYKGQPGGLYPTGNLRPAAHEAAGLALAQAIRPLNTAGNPDPRGVVGFLAVGMSNAATEADAFLTRIQGDPSVESHVLFANGSAGGVDATDMADFQGTYWSVDLPARLQFYGLDPDQVQVVWLKQADSFPVGGFPASALHLADLLVQILNNLHQYFPNLKIAYLNSRSYAGYSISPLNPEPYAYEQGFAVKWVIERQLDGDPLLNHDPAAGAVRAPWLSWGVYMWADGLTPRSDGMAWGCADYQFEGTHPSSLGADKVAGLLLEQFSSDPTATPWFLAAGQGPCGMQNYAGLYGQGTPGAAGVPGIAASEPATIPTAAPLHILGYDMPPAATAMLLFGLVPIPEGKVPLFDGWLLVSPLASRTTTTNAAGNANLMTTTIADNPTLCGITLYWQWLVADAAAPSGVSLSPGLVLSLGD